MTNATRPPRFTPRRPPHPDLERAPYFISTRTFQHRRLFREEVARRAVEKGRVWQEGFYERTPRTVAELNRYIEYIHRNPVDAGLVERDEDYLYSSAREAIPNDYHRWFEDERE